MDVADLLAFSIPKDLARPTTQRSGMRFHVCSISVLMDFSLRPCPGLCASAGTTAAADASNTPQTRRNIDPIKTTAAAAPPTQAIAVTASLQ
jgi:hypothetical protein